MERQRQKEEQEQRMLEARARYKEKTKSLLVFEPIVEDKPRKSGGRVRFPFMKFMKLAVMSIFCVRDAQKH